MKKNANKVEKNVANNNANNPNLNEFGEPFVRNANPENIAEVETAETAEEKTGFESLDKIADVKKAPVVKEPKAPTAYGLTIEAICAAPNAKIEEIKVIVEEKTGKESNMVSLRTVYTDVHRVITLLRKNDLMK